MVRDVVSEKPTIKCTRRIYEVSSGGRVVEIASNKVIMGEVLEALLREDYELEKFVENFEITRMRIVSVIPIQETLPLIKAEEKHPMFAKLPNRKQRRWMIIHEMPDDREITQQEWVEHMSKKNYDRKQVQGVVSGDFRGLLDLGNLQKITMGKYKIIDKEIYKDDKKFLDHMEKLKSGGKLVLV